MNDAVRFVKFLFDLWCLVLAGIVVLFVLFIILVAYAQHQHYPISGITA